MANDTNQSQKITESASLYDDLEQKPIGQILKEINEEDKKVAQAVERTIPDLDRLVTAILQRLESGGRVFYVGAGTSGRLGVLDASEIPPTYGVEDLFFGVIAGGDDALRQAVEKAEDSETNGATAVKGLNISCHDSVIGISASGSTPFVIGAIKAANEAGALTACITCNKNTAIGQQACFAIEAIVGPEYVTGSTRMKSGTAAKMILNMISTTLMIKSGHVKGNRMVDMQLKNAKLIHRGTKMIADMKGVSEDEALRLLLANGSVKRALGET